MKIIRYIARLIVVVGIFLLIRVVYQTATGDVDGKLFPRLQSPWLAALGSLALRLPVPLHVIAVGMVIQRRWLTPVWSKIAWLAVVVSGCWLGLALGFKIFFLS